MPQPKSLPKERYIRQRAATQTRQALAAMTPCNLHNQSQSSFFRTIPGEIRFQVYQHVLSQQPDCGHPIDTHSIYPLYRPGHTHQTSIETALLLTCRLVYCEAHAIPLRSFTHHSRHLGTLSRFHNVDTWLHRISKQRGAQLYHLHDNLVALSLFNFSRFLLPHLHWRRISWTICAYLLPPILHELEERLRISATLASLVLPSSCQEVNLEFETREDSSPDWPHMQEQIAACRALSLKKADGTTLEIDQRYVVRYTWRGSGHARWGVDERAGGKEEMRYDTIRLCWRGRVPNREYMSFDLLDCLMVEEGDVNDVRQLK